MVASDPPADRPRAARLDNIRVVLVEPTHPGNIGSSARAMRTMGLDALWLVAPKRFPSPDASALAAGADEILERARVVPTLDAALADATLVLGATPRSRRVPMPELSPREAAARAIQHAAHGTVALVFGTERIGLTNADVERCHAAVAIPTGDAYDSLNLSHAVQVLCYELLLATRAPEPEAALAARLTPQWTVDEPAADQARIEAFFAHLDEALNAVDFFKGRPSTTIMRRLRRVFLRAELSTREVLILRGILADVERAARLGGTDRRRSRDVGADAADAADQ